MIIEISRSVLKIFLFKLFKNTTEQCKICKVCKKVKSLEKEFYYKKKSNTYSPECKNCIREKWTYEYHNSEAINRKRKQQGKDSYYRLKAKRATGGGMTLDD